MLTIRIVLETDKNGWLALWNQYLDFYEQAVSAEVTDQTWKCFFVEGGHKCIVAVDSEIAKTVGFATYLIHPSTWTLNGYCYLEDLFVDPLSRGKGVGRQLIQSVVAIAEDAKIRRVYWHTQSDNLVAQRLYDKVAKQSEMIQYRIVT